jgi:hypothetical protein
LRLWWPSDDEKRWWCSELVGSMTWARRKRVGDNFGCTEGETRAPLIGPGNARDKRPENRFDDRRWWWILNALTITRRGNRGVAHHFGGGEEVARASLLLGD